MGVLGVALAMILPTLFGTLCVKWLMREIGPGAWGLAIGYGYLIGFALMALGLAIQGVSTGSLSPWGLLVFFGTGSVAVWARLPVSDRDVALPSIKWLLALRAMPPFALLLLCWCTIRGLSLSYELFDRGLYGWDAWSHWAYRARVWVEARNWITFVSPEAWLADRQPGVVTLIGAHDPKLISLIAAWPSLALGKWTEWAASMPWLGLWVALGFGVYGQTRRWGASSTVAMVSSWLVLSIPFVGSQIALAGYADLWLAAALGFAFMAFLSWARGGDRWQAALVAVCLVIAILTKFEAMVWALFFVPAVAAFYFGFRGSIAAGVAILAGFVLLQQLSSGNASMLELEAQRGGLLAMLNDLFITDHWHLLSTALSAAFLITVGSYLRRDRGLLAQRWQHAAYAWVCSALVALYMIFFWMPSAEWHRLGISGDRFILHVTPALIFWCMTVWVNISQRLTAGSNVRT